MIRSIGSGTPTVSVIVPNYNHERYLRQRLDSILSQSFTDYELILLDDRSTDGSAELLREYASREPRVTHLAINEQNSGCTYRQWAKGLSLARGRYVWLAESDDYADPAFLATMVDALERHPGAVMAFSGSVMVDTAGHPLKMDWDEFPAGDEAEAVMDHPTLMRRRMMMNCRVYNASMVVWRRDAAPAIDGAITSKRLCGDWLFWSRLSRRGSAVEVRRKLNYFRQHPAKVTQSGSREGRYFTEGLPVMAENAAELGLTPLQRRVMAGRVWKRLGKFPGLLRESGPEIMAGLDRLSPGASRQRRRLIALYEADKYLNFARLR